MQLPSPLFKGTVEKRYKRFLADITLEDGSTVTAHCPNSGSMKTCIEPGWQCLVSHHPDPKRKLKYTLQLVHNSQCWICVNTHLANPIVEEALLQCAIPSLKEFSQVKRELKLNSETRIDFVLTDPRDNRCVVEVKTVTLLSPENLYAFPDSVTTRGQKHLKALMEQKQLGHRSVLLFLVQRSDGKEMVPADWIDPLYGQLLREAKEKGVEILVYQAQITDKEITLGSSLPLTLS